ncbi:hypothetical protein GQ53DRAFT_464881 [Thozetella sp. PMI_491]|nr:hypothetical protein GQ53DRAFT_464881 [Thozetella sp. PMI_491]
MMSDGHLSDPVRRKTRKGTRSCWECKRRKVRCIYANPNDAVCTGCARRCLKCVSQEFPEHRSTAAAKTRLVGDRIGRVEEMVRQLVQQAGPGPGPGPAIPDLSPPAPRSAEDVTQSQPSSAIQSQGMCTPAPSDTLPCASMASCTPSMDGLLPDSLPHGQLAATPSRPTTIEALTPPGGLDPGHERLSASLLAAFPAQSDIDTIIDACGDVSVFFFQVLGKPYGKIKADGIVELNHLRARYPPGTHPVLIARQMLMIAAAMQYNNLEGADRLKSVTEPPRDIMRRLAETAIRLVASDDTMMGTVEGLDCIVLEGLFQANCGNLRRSWLAWRRAIGVAQLWCLHRQSPPPLHSMQLNYNPDPRYLWYRLIYVDRFMSLMLGLPQASRDVSMDCEADMLDDTPVGQFERRLCVAASRILERNDREPSSDDSKFTQEVDMQLQKAAGALPGRWWLAPNLAGEPNDMQLFWDLNRLFSQIYYYNLINQLHLPYMLRLSGGSEQRRYDYSRLTCVNASRELLNRFILFRTYTRVAHCCRVVDFSALLASLTLLLAHIDGHSAATPSDNVLAHQRLSDRAMMEQVLDNMDMMGSLSNDLLSNKTADLLRQLLAIETDAAGGSSYSFGASTASPPEVGSLQLCVPYLGLVTITRGGGITRGPPDAGPPPSSQERNLIAALSHGEPVPLCVQGETPSARTVPPAPVAFAASTTRASAAQQQDQVIHSKHDAHQPSSAAELTPCCEGDPALPETSDIPTMSQPLDPGLTANGDQWAFQGIDMAFFNNLLMRENSTQPHEGSHDGWMWAR